MQRQARAFVPCKPFSPGACAIKLFTAVTVAVGEQARKYVTAINFQPSLIFACNGRQNNLAYHNVATITAPGLIFLG